MISAGFESLVSNDQKLYLFENGHKFKRTCFPHLIKQFFVVLAACSKPTCPEDQTCSVDAQRNAVCACPDMCPSLGEPVCGSDGKTYENICKARKESCEKKKGLSFKRGPCGELIESSL